MSISLAIALICACSVWATIWIIAYTNSSSSPEWMLLLAGGPVTLIVYGFCRSVTALRTFYYRHNWKGVVVDKDGNKFKCESRFMNEICEKYQVEPAFDFVKSIEYKPYKPKSYSDFYQSNPRYIHKKQTNKFSKLTLKKGE